MKIQLLLTFFICSAFGCNNPGKVKIESSENIVRLITDSAVIEYPEIVPAWHFFISVVKSRNFSELKRISCDSIRTCHKYYSSDKFIAKCFPEIFDSTLLSKIDDSTKTEYLNSSVDIKYFPASFFEEASTKGNSGSVKEIVVTKSVSDSEFRVVTFKFIRTNQGYKFIEYDSFGGPECCR